MTNLPSIQKASPQKHGENSIHEALMGLNLPAEGNSIYAPVSMKPGRPRTLDRAAGLTIRTEAAIIDEFRRYCLRNNITLGEGLKHAIQALKQVNPMET